MTSHLITDSFVSGVAFFPLLVSSLSPLIPFPFRFSKKSGKVVLPSSCGVFLCVFFVAGENSVGSGSPSTQRRRRRRRQRRRRDVGPCGSSSSRAGRFVRDRPGVAADRAEPSTRRDLCWLLWKETRQEESGGGKSQREGRETLTDKRGREREIERAREQLGSDGGGAGVQWVEAATGVREQEQAQPPATSRARALTGGHTQEAGEVEGRAGKEEGARAVPLYAAFTYFRKWQVLSNEWNE